MSFTVSPYEITVYTGDVSGAGTDADVYVVLFGKEKSTSQKSLCVNKQERKKYFERKSVDKFVIEVTNSICHVNFERVCCALFSRLTTNDIQ